MRPVPLRWRMSVSIAATILVAVAAIEITAYLGVRSTLMQSVSRSLNSKVKGVIDLLNFPSATVTFSKEIGAVVGIGEHPHPGHVRIWMEGSDHDLLAGPQRIGKKPAPTGDDAIGAVKPPRLGGSRIFDPANSDDYRNIWAKISTPDGVVNIVISVSIAEAQDELSEYRGVLYSVSALAVIITLLLVPIITNISLRPINATAKSLSKITGQNVENAKFEREQTPLELRPFVDAVTALLERLGRALREQKRFVADASHELRTPLSIARSTIDVALVKERSSENYRDTLVELEEDLVRMGDLIEELLILAHLDEVASPQQIEQFNLKVLLNEIIERYESVLARTGGRMTLHGGDVTVSGDADQIRRLFSNLLDNALRYGPAGGVITVTVNTRDGQVVTKVHDQGGSIPEESLPHLFDRFYRVDKSRTRATGGVGLGLSIAQEIARRHGGSITVVSSPAEGTCFTVTLPASTQPSPDGSAAP